MNTYYIYILASQQNGTLYIGITNDLRRRVWQHKQGVYEGFTQKYHVNRLVWFDSAEDIQAIIRREKQLKRWNREWKIQLIEKENPNWDDLYEQLL